MRPALSLLAAAAAVLAMSRDMPAGAQPRGVGIANPASTNCLQQGGRSEIRNGAQGQYGVCIFPDGRVCEEWALFRDGRCVRPRD
jgi:putative hemolysin